MKLSSYFICISFVFCSCADATSQPKIPELTCPSILPAEKDFPVSWVVLGKVPTDKLVIREADFIEGNAIAEKARLQGAKERIFSRDSLDQWTDFEDRSEATVEYLADHADAAMMCTYSKRQEEMFNIDKNVVLLIPLPSKKSVACLLVRREVHPLYEISCKP